MAFKARIWELAVKTETTPGTFNAPATNGTESLIMIRGTPVVTLDDEMHERDVITTDQSLYSAVVGKTRVRISGLQVAMRRHASGTTSDQWMQLLLAAGMVKTTPASNTVHKRSSKFSDVTNLSAYVYAGSTGLVTDRIAVKGMCVSSLSVDHVVGQASIMNIELVGVYNGHTTGGAVNAITHDSTKESAFLNSSFTFGAVGLQISRCSWDLGIEAVEVEDVNVAEGIKHFYVASWNPTFRMDPLLEVTGTFDFNGGQKAGTEYAIAFNIQGSALTFAAPKAQLRSIPFGERSGLRMVDATCSLNRNSGDDEIVITAA